MSHSMEGLFHSASQGAERYHVRAVVRALDLLVELGRWDRPVGLRTLARRTELHPATVHRLLESLRSRGFAQQTADGGYLVGSRAFELGSTFLRNVSIWSQANRLAEQLATATDETANVGVLDDGQVLYIAIARGQQEIGIESLPGTRQPAHCTALGKAILADLTWPDVSSILDRHPAHRLSTNTLTDPRAIHTDLVSTRRRGYAVDNEERTPGVMCIGAAILDHTHQPAGGLSISGPAFRVRERGVTELAALVTDNAREASRQLGAN